MERKDAHHTKTPLGNNITIVTAVFDFIISITCSLFSQINPSAFAAILQYIYTGNSFIIMSCFMSWKLNLKLISWNTPLPNLTCVSNTFPTKMTFFFATHLILCVTGRMDIDISFLEDCRRLAKQCKMTVLIEELENKCKQVYDFGKFKSDTKDTKH